MLGRVAIEGSPRVKTRDLMSSLQKHWEAARVGDVAAELSIYAEDAVCDFPQSGESARGLKQLEALRVGLPEKPRAMEFLRILGSGNLWVTECVISYDELAVFCLSVMEFKDGKVFHETQYYAPYLQPPAWHAKWTGKEEDGAQDKA